MEEVRHQFREDLKELEHQTLGGLDMVTQQLDRALESLSYQDVELAGMVVADDDRIDGRYLEVHQGILSLLARQAPVAGDLRRIAALLHVIRCVERMGDQCVNIAKLVPLSGYESPKDKDILDAIERMGQLARRDVTTTRTALKTRDVALARAKKHVGFYIAHPVSDGVAEIEGVQDLVNGLRMSMMQKGLAAFEDTPEELVELFSITGTPEECRQKLDNYKALPHLALHTSYVPPFTADESEDCYLQIIDAFKR